jgi:hypothetical protein
VFGHHPSKGKGANVREKRNICFGVFNEIISYLKSKLYAHHS